MQACAKRFGHAQSSFILGRGTVRRKRGEREAALGFTLFRRLQPRTKTLLRALLLQREFPTYAISDLTYCTGKSKSLHWRNHHFFIASATPVSSRPSSLLGAMCATMMTRKGPRQFLMFVDRVQSSCFLSDTQAWWAGHARDDDMISREVDALFAPGDRLHDDWDCRDHTPSNS